MKEITLPILHHSSNTSTLKEIGIDYSLEECEVREIIFYHINAISEYYDDDKQYTNIHTNNSEYISTLPIEEVRKIILKTNVTN